MPNLPRAIAFDVNGTMLDLRPLKPHLQRVFGASFTTEEWFPQIIQYAMATSLSGDYRDFGDIALSVLRMAASSRGVTLSQPAEQDIRKQFRDLPPYSEVKRNLTRLREAGFILIALSNSGTISLESQLQNAGIAQCFDYRISVERVRRFKPAPEPYRLAASTANVKPAEMLMVAAHPWDLMGATRAGCQTAFVKRAGNALYPGTGAPDYQFADFTKLADKLVGKESNLLVTVGAVAVGLGFAVFASRRPKQLPDPFGDR